MHIDASKMAALLVKRRMNQKQLAEKAGISRITVSSIKSGKSCLPIIGKAIADALDVTLEEITE